MVNKRGGNIVSVRAMETAPATSLNRHLSRAVRIAQRLTDFRNYSYSALTAQPEVLHQSAPCSEDNFRSVYATCLGSELFDTDCHSCSVSGRPHQNTWIHLSEKVTVSVVGIRLPALVGRSRCGVKAGEMRVPFGNV